MGEVLREGTKADGGKNRLDLLPFDALIEEARVMTLGAQKYEARNWEKGMAWSRLFGAALRHMFDWFLGQDKDPESGLHPLAHAACDIHFLLAYALRGTPGDDRPRYPAKPQEEDRQLRLCFAAERHECNHLSSKEQPHIITPFGHYCGKCGKKIGGEE